MPPESSLGFAPADWALLLITSLFLLAALAWRPAMVRAFTFLAKRKRTCVLLLFLLPILLRLLLLPQHPVPTADSFEDFGHLLMADTLLHGRFTNPPHAMPQFFETLFVLQEPTYSSAFPPGLGLLLALSRLMTGIPWTGVLLASGALSASCYWMLRAWITPPWALLGGILAVIEFGPLCQWTNSYSGGFLAATGGCLVFGALPRLSLGRRRDGLLLGAGFGLHLLTLPHESVLLLLAVGLFFVPGLAPPQTRTPSRRALALALAAALPAILLLLFHNHAVTHSWTTLPGQLSHYPFRVPPSLTKFLPRLEFRVRYYRFFFLPPLYLALLAFLFSLRALPQRWLAASLAIFALGTNLLPYLEIKSLAGATCLFVLAGVIGLKQLSRVRIRGMAIGPEIAQILIVLCLAEFMIWYALHLFETPAIYPLLQYETWDAINHQNPQRRITVKRQLDAVQGQLLVFVRYSTYHLPQNEWVWNNADIDASRIVYARDLGPEENQKLIRYYPTRKVLLLEPDAAVPQLSHWDR